MKKNHVHPKEFERVKVKAEALYKTIGKVRCPYLSRDVHFSSSGLEHLKFHGPRRARKRIDQYMRLKLLHLAPRVVRCSHTVQGISELKGFVRVKVNKRWDKMLKDITYYEFVAVMNGARVRVVVKEVAGGEPHFWSIMPFWRKDKKTGRRRLYTGDPEND